MRPFIILLSVLLLFCFSHSLQDYKSLYKILKVKDKTSITSAVLLETVEYTIVSSEDSILSTKQKNRATLDKVSFLLKTKDPITIKNRTRMNMKSQFHRVLQKRSDCNGRNLCFLYYISAEP